MSSVMFDNCFKGPLLSVLDWGFNQVFLLVLKKMFESINIVLVLLNAWKEYTTKYLAWIMWKLEGNLKLSLFKIKASYKADKRPSRFPNVSFCFSIWVCKSLHQISLTLWVVLPWHPTIEKPVACKYCWGFFFLPYYLSSLGFLLLWWNTITKAAWGQKGSFGLNFYILVHSMGTQAGLESGSRQWCRGLGGVLLVGLLLMACSAGFFFVDLRTTRPGMVPPTMEWVISHQSLRKCPSDFSTTW